MDPFRLFASTAYTFLQLAKTAHGDEIVAEYDASGIFKERDGLTNTGNAELHAGSTDAAATLKMRPDEVFIAFGLIGNGIRVGDKTYRIVGAKEGRNFDTGQLEFWKLTLSTMELAVWHSPLE